MSISNRHSVLPFSAGQSVALTDQRLSKVGYKLTEKMKKAGKKVLPSVCVSLPLLEAPSNEQMERLNPFLLEVLEKAQDGIIRGIYEKNSDVSSISDDEVSIDACITFLEESETGGRMTSALLQEWFSLNVSDALKEFLSLHAAKKYSGSDLEDKVAQSLKGYEDMFASMAGGKTHFDVAQRSKLTQVLALTEDGDEVAEKLMKRLEGMEKKDAKIAASLGLIDFS